MLRKSTAVKSDRGAIDGYTIAMGGTVTLLILVLGGIVALIVGAIIAAANTPSTGTIAAKHYTAPYTSTFCHLVGKITVCSPMYHGPQWEFDLVNKSEHKEGWVSVSEGAYNARSVGDWYSTKQG